MNYESSKESIENSVRELDPIEEGSAETGYLDLVLIHWPTSIAGEAGLAGRLDTWKGIVESKKAGLVRSIGVSNFTAKHLEEMIAALKE